ncbi:hypothetical protein [Chelativorans sp. AA-79]|uniref:hypothetical protein n=1 Tax=Chelativorans sp. AA-79 TaxID=3028735 RepID=UPI0023F88B24|nr:hypothetical protein [Chelativorans sp. AA-79]WEX09584.1 hypothetical protein PVE73_01005 [Chelativorans sp. AA-79]
MEAKREHEMKKATSGSTEESAPSKKGGSQARKAQEWGGGSKGSKGPITKDDRHNPNSSQKS